MSYLDERYIDFEFDTSDSIVTTLYVEGHVPATRLAKEIAAESSVGTWTAVRGLTPEIFERLAARVVKIDEKAGIFQVAYPSELFEEGSIPQMLSLFAGNIFGMKIVENMRLLDITFPSSILSQYPGPELGIEGARRMLDLSERRPILGTIVKPKMGLDYKQHAQVAYEAWKGGIDFVKDDEPQTDQSWIRFHDRISEVLTMADKIKDETGRKVMYAANITGTVDKMLERADFVKSNGGTCIMIDVLTTGFSAVQYIRQQNYGLVIHAHRAMHAAMTKHPKHGIHMVVLAKLLRLAGVDTLHSGTVVGKMEGGYEDTKQVYDALRDTSWPQKPVLPVASGGLHAGHVGKLVDLFGMDLLINAGGGIHGHPQGTVAGAASMKQALEARLAGMDPWTYAEEHHLEELKQALESWKVPRAS